MDKTDILIGKHYFPLGEFLQCIMNSSETNDFEVALEEILESCETVPGKLELLTTLRKYIENEEKILAVEGIRNQLLSYQIQ